MAIDTHARASHDGAMQRLRERRGLRTQRSHPVRKAVSQKNRVNVALPFSMMRVESAPAKVDDWISLVRLVVSMIGFSVVVRQLGRIGKTRTADQAGS